jgi:hypothetical protein
MCLNKIRRCGLDSRGLGSCPEPGSCELGSELLGFLHLQELDETTVRRTRVRNESRNRDISVATFGEFP